MKNIIVALSLAALATIAFGQGKIRMDNTGRPVTFTTDASLLLPPDAPLAGQIVPSGEGHGLPSGVRLMMALCVGVTADAEALLTAVPLSAPGSVDGYMNPLNITLPAGYRSGTPLFFELFSYNGSFASPQLAFAVGAYWGTSGEFTMTPGVAGPVPISTGGGSTWLARPLYISLVPEPATYALAGFGAILTVLLGRWRAKSQRWLPVS